MPKTEQNRPSSSALDPQLLVWGLILICALIEIVLWGSEQGFWGSDRLRRVAYEYGGFWPGLLADWRPNYPGQPALMFLTYGFLHGGMGHMIVNMITLWSLGIGVGLRAGAGGLALIYLSAIFGGALGYGLLAQTATPMVGASGALFGLAGALLAWANADRRRVRSGPWPVLRVILFLIAINVAMYWALNGHLAWQTHLGGFVIGWIVALAVGRSPQTE